MRCFCTGALALLLIVPLLTGQAAAEPPAPPGLPFPGLQFPGLPAFPPPAEASGAILPGIQQWIDQVIPPPPIGQAPQPVPRFPVPSAYSETRSPVRRPKVV